MKFKPSVVGVAVLTLVFVLMLAGRFSLGRLSADLAFVDVRWVIYVAAVLLFFLWNVVEQPPITPANSGVATHVLMVWAGWLAMSAGWAPAGVDVWAKSEDIIILMLSVLLASATFRRLDSASISYVWILLFIASLVYLADAVLRGGSVVGRFAAFGGGPNVFVRIMVLGVLAALALAVLRGIWWTLLATPFLALGAFLSGSRGGLFAAALISIVGLVPIMRRLRVRLRVLVIAIGVIGIVSLPGIVGRDQMNDFYLRFIVLPFIEGDVSSRDVLGARAIELFEANPLGGAGVGAVEWSFMASGPGLHAHNLVLATAAEGGLVGLACLTVALVLFFATVWASRPLDAETLFASIAGFYILGTSMFSGDFYDSRFAWFFFVMAATIARRREPRRTHLVG